MQYTKIGTPINSIISRRSISTNLCIRFLRTGCITSDLCSSSSSSTCRWKRREKKLSGFITNFRLTGFCEAWEAIGSDRRSTAEKSTSDMVRYPQFEQTAAPSTSARIRSNKPRTRSACRRARATVVRRVGPRGRGNADMARRRTFHVDDKGVIFGQP